jgi:two-component system, chemotaxis family, chemotaxis protein CheY
LDEKIKFTNMRALIVDDHVHIRKAMVKIFISSGVSNIEEASSGSQAIQLLNTKAFDIVLCDLYMPGINGFEVIHHIRTRDLRSDIPIVVVSGEANRADIVKAYEQGASDYILKPFVTDEFIKKVNKAYESYIKPTDKLKLIRAAEDCLLWGKVNKANEYAKHALKIDEKSARALHILVLTLIKKGDTKKALEEIEKGIDAHPEFFGFFASKANILFTQNKTTEAIEAMGIELQLNPKQHKRQVMMGNKLMKTGQPDLAMEHFREALKERPKQKHALSGMANANLAIGDIDKAIYYLQRYRRKHPNDSTPLKKLVQVCKSAGVLKKAEYTLRSEINQYPERVDAYTVLASLYFKHKSDIDKALKTLAKLFKVDSENVDGLSLRGQIYLAEKQYKKAEHDLQKAAKLELSVNTLIPLAKIKNRLGKTKSFLRAAEQAFYMDPSNGKAILLKAQALLATNQPTKAYIVALRAKARGVKSPSLLKLMAAAQDAREQPEPAIRPVAS